MLTINQVRELIGASVFGEEAAGDLFARASGDPSRFRVNSKYSLEERIFRANRSAYAIKFASMGEWERFDRHIHIAIGED